MKVINYAPDDRAAIYALRYNALSIGPRFLEIYDHLSKIDHFILKTDKGFIRCPNVPMVGYHGVKGKAFLDMYVRFPQLPNDFYDLDPRLSTRSRRSTTNKRGHIVTVSVHMFDPNEDRYDPLCGHYVMHFFKEDTRDRDVVHDLYFERTLFPSKEPLAGGIQFILGQIAEISV